jgi:hypothetical protein
MSDEFDSSSVDSNNVYYSPFWPMAIVLIGFIIWLGYQLFTLNEQRTAMNSQLEQMQPTLQQAQMAQNRLISLLKDLAQTSSKDQYAAQIMREAVQAGLLRVSPNTNAATAGSPAAGSSTSSAPAATTTSDTTP